MATNWREVYQAAILETDWSKIEERIQAADLAINARLFEFSQDHGGTPEENQRIKDALSGLTVLRRDVAAWQAKKSDVITIFGIAISFCTVLDAVAKSFLL